MPYQVVCHYVPDIAKDERIIFAVIVIDGDRHEIRFTNDWERIDNFVGHSVDTLKALAQEEWNSEVVKNFLKFDDWKIHFSEHKGTILPFHEAIVDAVQRYLKDGRPLNSSDLAEYDTVLSPEGVKNFNKITADGSAKPKITPQSLPERNHDI